LPVYQPKSAKTDEFLAAMRAARAELAVVVAYGKILPQAVLDTFALGCINVHASLLPAYRGAAPIQWAVINGEPHTGVSIMQLDAGMDTGAVYCTTRTEIGANETSGQLMERLAQVGSTTLAQCLPGIMAKQSQAVPQDHALATHAPMFTKGHGGVDFARAAAVIASLIRGVDPWPGAVARHRGEPMKLFGAQVVRSESGAAGRKPGTILAVDGAGMRVACGEGVVQILEVQAAGRKRMRPQDLLAGRGLAVGEELETPDDAVLRA